MGVFGKYILKKIRYYVLRSLPEAYLLFEIKDRGMNLSFSSKEICCSSDISDTAKIQSPSHISESSIGAYSYISQNAYISYASIGKFCSIGPNLICGWGIHPTDGISTSPMFYSTLKQNGTTLADYNKIEERKLITIGNDVFIGANVTILDGVTIGDGAIIGAGAVVSKDIPPYAIAVGVPIHIVRYRFSDEQISKLEQIQWWNFSEEKLKDIEQMFFDVNKFIDKYTKKQ